MEILVRSFGALVFAWVENFTAHGIKLKVQKQSGRGIRLRRMQREVA